MKTITKIQSIPLLTALLLSSACNSDNIPDEYIPSQYLKTEQHEIEIGMANSFDITADCSSTWEAVPGATWCHIEDNKIYGQGTLTFSVDANRTEAERSCYIYLNTFFKETPIRDSVLIIQAVNTLPVLEITNSSPRLISGNGGKIDLTMNYNYGVSVTVTYSKGSGWIHTEPTQIKSVDKNPVSIPVSIIVDESDIPEERGASVTFTSSDNPEVKTTIEITQKAMVPKTPAIKAFADDFNTCDNHFQPYEGEGWTIVFDPPYIPGQPPLPIRQFTNGFKGLLIHGQGIPCTAYAVMPPFNIRAMQNKSLSYSWAAGNAVPVEDEKFELVASTDYRDDAFSATWFVVENLTNVGNKVGMSPFRTREVDLSSLADHQHIYLAFRYKGASSAYRFDNLKVGDVGN